MKNKHITKLKNIFNIFYFISMTIIWILILVLLITLAISNGKTFTINKNKEIKDMQSISYTKLFTPSEILIINNKLDLKTDQMENKEVETIETTVIDFTEPDYLACSEEEDLILMNVPDIDSSFKGFMDYRCITHKNSDQWKLQEIAYTDEFGLRKINEDYCVAVGTYYAERCGIRYKVTLDTGNEFNIIVADIKNDISTDKNHKYLPMGNGYGNILEFIVDDEVISNEIWTYGSVDYYEHLQGNVESMQLLEEFDIKILEN